MRITDDIIYVGVNDHKIDLFEGQYIVPNGMAYNSYLIIDEKVAIMDSVEIDFKDEWFNNIDKNLNGKTVDYIIIQHMEPDHSSSILEFSKKYPNAIFVSSNKSFEMMKNFFGNDFADRRIIVKEGDILDLGKHKLSFIGAPMVHWPEVIMTYDAYSKVLFSADAFGKFGANDVEDEEGWACEARRYYFGIVGKYGAQVQNVLAKAKALDVKVICSLHGPVLDDNLDYYFDIYNTWSSYGVESEGVCIAYTSVYGNTKKAVELLAEELKKNGCKKVAVSDLARDDMAEIVEDAFRYGKIVLATTTYNGEIFPFMREFILTLVEHGFKNKTVGMIENGSWAPFAVKKMKELLEPCKNITYTESNVKILSALNEDSINQVKALAKELC